ncbi:MAG: hypothetical protein VX843_00720 [Actinomycetota bacterium]|nr:hypothetical protein [Acidimicrobiaceae bacterium]MEC9034615.1 hypothetical protein [Actinomycetota bacterium]MEE2645736.1 hypothetical protein [Actinomycetota bacterium]
MSKNNNDVVTLKIPSSSPFTPLVRVGLTTLFRIHRINSDNLESFTQTIQEAVEELSKEGSTITAFYKVKNDEVSVELKCKKKTLRFTSS